jgi:hypothetical protein
MVEEACKIEIDILGKPIGRQDQYAAAFGGLNYIRFNPGHTVDVEPVPCRAETLAELEKHTILMYTNQKRNADSILGKQSQGVRRYRNFKRPFSASGRVRMYLRVVKDAIRRSRMRDVSGPSAVRGARIRGVLASRASAGQRRLSARGVEPGGRGARPEIRPVGIDRRPWPRLGAVPGRTSRGG